MKLVDWIYKNKMSRTELAKKLNYNKVYIFEVVRQDAIPGRKLAEQIRDFTGNEVTLEDLGYAAKIKERKLCPCCGSPCK